MIAYFGMSDKLPNLCYYSNDEYSFNRPYSEKTAELIDEEVKKMVNEQYARAKKILSEHQEGHQQLTQILIDKEVIFADDVEHIFGCRPRRRSRNNRTKPCPTRRTTTRKKKIRQKTNNIGKFLNGKSL